jgi:hypothetical protein
LLESLRTALNLALHQTFWLVAAIALVGCLAVRLLPGGHPAEHVYRDEPTLDQGIEVAG